MKQFLTLARDAFDKVIHEMKCAVRGHQWKERMPHRMFDINDFDCTRCGAYREQ